MNRNTRKRDIVFIDLFILLIVSILMVLCPFTSDLMAEEETLFNLLLNASLLEFDYVQDLFYDLWKKSGFGFIQFERSSFLIWDSSGFILQDWGMTINNTRAQMYIGPIPRRTVAIVHTHPNGCSQYPSLIDRKTADKMNLVMFVLSRKGITCYDPASQSMVKLADHHFWKNIKRRQKKGHQFPLFAKKSE